MSVKEFNEREKQRSQQTLVCCNASREMFDAFLDEMYYENFATEFERQNPDAYQEQLNSFIHEHSL